MSDTLREKLTKATCEWCEKGYGFMAHHNDPSWLVHDLQGNWDSCTSKADALLPIIRAHAAEVALNYKSKHDDHYKWLQDCKTSGAIAMLLETME